MTFKNTFAWADIPIGEHALIEIPSYFKSEEGGQFDVVKILNNILYVQVKYAHLWYEKFLNFLLDNNSVGRKVDPYLIIRNTVICVLCVYGCTF